MDPRILKVAGLTEQIAAADRHARELRDERARIAWQTIDSTDETVASIARAIGEPEIRFRKSIMARRVAESDASA